VKQAIILAAGEGQRLRPFTSNKPKAMLSIAGKPILGYVVDALARNGIRDIILVVGYHKEHIFDWLGSGEEMGVSITYVTQDTQLGTAHALLQAKGMTEDEFLVLPGDNLIGADAIAHLVSMEPEAILVKTVDNPARYGVVTLEGDVLKEVVEKPKEAKGYIINTGIYAFSSDIFEFIGTMLGIPDVLNSMIAGGHSLKAVEVNGAWFDIVYPWDILSLNDAVLRGIPPDLGGIIERGAVINGLVSVGKNTVIRANSYITGPVVIGEGCDIGPNVCISPATSIGDNVVIAPFTQIENCVIGDDVNIGASGVVQNCVIDSGCVIGGRFTACSDETEVKIDDEYHSVKMGAMLGEGCKLGDSVVAQPGVIAGNYSRVKRQALISGRLPDRSLVL